MLSTFPNLTVHNASNTLPQGLTSLPFRNLYYHSVDVTAALYIPLLACGISGNIFNIIVYVKTGVRDNMTVSFLALSSSDLLFLVLISPHLFVTFINHFIQTRMGASFNWKIDPKILRYPFYWYAFLFYEVSILITVYISIVRCACVVIPFKVKNAFTNRRAVITFIAFFIVMFLLRIPMFMKKSIVREFDPITNTTRVVYREVDDGGLAEKLNDIVSRNILNWASFVTVILCVIVLVNKLEASAKFRSAATVSSPPPSKATKDTMGITSVQESRIKESGQYDTVSKEVKQLDLDENSMDDNKKQRPDPEKTMTKKPVVNKGQRRTLSPREAQAVRSVILVAVVFIACQAPLMAYTLARRFESQFDDTDDMRKGNVRKYIFLFAFCSNISKVFAIVNASVNILVYYNFNSRYRQTVRHLWSNK